MITLLRNALTRLWVKPQDDKSADIDRAALRQARINRRVELLRKEYRTYVDRG